jgi:hypothetical protein
LAEAHDGASAVESVGDLLALLPVALGLHPVGGAVVRALRRLAQHAVGALLLRALALVVGDRQ